MLVSSYRERLMDYFTDIMWSASEEGDGSLIGHCSSGLRIRVSDTLVEVTIEGQDDPYSVEKDSCPPGTPLTTRVAATIGAALLNAVAAGAVPATMLSQVDPKIVPVINDLLVRCKKEVKSRRSKMKEEVKEMGLGLKRVKEALAVLRGTEALEA